MVIDLLAVRTNERYICIDRVKTIRDVQLVSVINFYIYLEKMYLKNKLQDDIVGIIKKYLSK